MLQGLGHQEFSKYSDDEILFFIQPIDSERGSNARLGVLVKEKRKTLQNQMSNFGANLRIGNFTRRPVVFLD